jgi:hypothetical protein
MVGSLAALAITAAPAQQDLDAGKTGPQLFAQDCAACHRSPQGLAKTVSGGALVSFLRQHYTSSSTSAGVVAAYVQAAGPAPRNERQKDQRRPEAAPGAAAPAAAAPAGRPTAAIPSAQPQAGQPAAGQPATGQPPAGTKQRERQARPGTPAAEPGAVDQRGRPLRKSRRALRAEQQQATSPGAETGATPAPAPPGPEAQPPVAPAAQSGQAAPARPATAAKPGFSDQLP